MARVLRSPRKLPERYNRRVTDRTRALVQRRHGRQRQYQLQRWTRIMRKTQERLGKVWMQVMRFSPWIALSVAVIFVCIIIFSPILSVREIRIIRTDRRVDIEHVQRALAPLFSEHLLFLTHKQTLPMVERAVPDLREMTLEKQYPSTLIVRVDLDPIVAQLDIVNPDGSAPEEEVDIGTGADVLGDYLTAQGVYVTYPPSLARTGTGLTTIRIVDWGVRPEPWKPLLDVEILERMGQAEDLLLRQFSQQTVLRAVYLRAREFHIQTQKHSLWFDMRSPVSEQIDRYRLFLQTIGADAATRYVDLRLQDRIVYR